MLYSLHYFTVMINLFALGFLDNISCCVISFPQKVNISMSCNVRRVGLHAKHFCIWCIHIILLGKINHYNIITLYNNNFLFSWFCSGCLVLIWTIILNLRLFVAHFCYFKGLELILATCEKLETICLYKHILILAPLYCNQKILLQTYVLI